MGPGRGNRPVSIVVSGGLRPTKPCARGPPAMVRVETRPNPRACRRPTANPEKTRARPRKGEAMPQHRFSPSTGSVKLSSDR